MKKITINKDQIRRIVRYEETFRQYAEVFERHKAASAFALEEDYQVTLKDLKTSIINILEEDPYCNDLTKYWVIPLYYLGIFSQRSDMARDIPLTEEDMIDHVWDSIFSMSYEISYPDDDEYWDIEPQKVSDFMDLKEILQEIELFEKNKDRPLFEREFTERQKSNYIRSFRYEWRRKNANETELDLCRKFIDELCEEGDVEALDMKGYACYGGNELYPCDWKTSRDCIEKLYELTDHPGYANTLGYIYYYGSCTDGEPEYEKAFRMFTAGAANGVYESIYKLADMYRHGYACKKSPQTAYKLYRHVYELTVEDFEYGSDSEFADAALRMGNVYMRGIGVDPDPKRAYRYYLQADLAAKRRAKNDSFFGNTNVMMSVQEAINEAKKQLPDDFHKQYTEFNSLDSYDSLHELEWAISDKTHGMMSARKLKNGDVKLAVKCEPNRKGSIVKPVLVTFETLDFCDVVTKLQYTAVDAEISSDFDDKKEVAFDEIFWNYRTERFELYYRDELTGWFKTDSFRFYPPRKRKPSGDLLRFVSVSFPSGNRTYDYLCDIPDVDTGDTVIVEGYDGETEAIVKSIFTAYESELGLPIERYKKVIRKA